MFSKIVDVFQHYYTQVKYSQTFRTILLKRLIVAKFGIKYDEDVPSFVTIDTFNFPLTSFPNSILIKLFMF